jgi:PAS domain S-box-containing protein
MQSDSPIPDGPSNTLDALHRFEARSDANGLLLRYASGRVRGLPGRQVLTVLGSVALGVLEDRALGLATLALGFLGDAADCAFLSYLRHRFRNGVVPQVWRRATILFALLQSVTIAACVALAWTASDRIGIVFVSTAFLFGGIINAGLARPYLRPAADVRLAVFGLTWMALTWTDLASAVHPSAWLADNAYLLIAGAMMAYSAIGYIGFIGRSFTRKLRFEHQLLRQQHALEQSSAQLALREAQARRLALVAENANDIVIIYTPEGRIDWVNPTFTRTLGFTLDEVRGKFPGAVLNPDCLDADKVEEIVVARKAARSFRAELRNRTRDGRTIWIETSSVPILNPDGSLAMTVQVERDVTAARTHAAELAEARIRAEAAADAKTRFLATMSHEIRTPLNGVVAMADVLAASSLSPDQAECVKAIRDSGLTLLALISDILDLSQIQSGALRLASEPFDAAALTEAVARIAQPVAQAKGLTLTCAPHDPVWLSGDAGRLRQILLNIVGNAVKFTATGGVEVTLSHGAETGGRIPLTVTVRDTGIGIPPDRHEAIFDSFTQADTSIHGQFGGTGLGLSISRHLAMAMGGGITVQSDTGQGATFVVSLSLPASAPAANPAGPAAADDRQPLLKLTGRRVLVAEDNRTNRLILRRLLEPLSLHLTEAENGAEAVAAYRDAPPDLILMDIQMPVMDGLAAIRAIREQEHARGWPRCPILVVTANAFAEDRAACESAGGDDFLPKPVRREALYDRIGRFLTQAA